MPFREIEKAFLFETGKLRKIKQEAKSTDGISPKKSAL